MKPDVGMAMWFGLPALLLGWYYDVLWAPNEIIAWPGMEVSEFNRLNKGRASEMKENASDWIGIDSPVTLVFRHGEEILRFTETGRGGGIQVSGTNVDRYPDAKAPARVNAIAFNIGGGMENIADLQPLLIDRCERLARIAEVEVKPVPDPETISRNLKEKISNSFIICSGKGANLLFHIEAVHVVSNSRHGGDYDYAFFNGALVAPANFPE